MADPHLPGEYFELMLTSMNNLALTYWNKGSRAEAVALLEEVLEKRKRILGEEHLATLTSMNSATYRVQGEAAALHEQVLEKRRRIQGDVHPAT